MKHLSTIASSSDTFSFQNKLFWWILLMKEHQTFWMLICVKLFNSLVLKLNGICPHFFGKKKVINVVKQILNVLFLSMLKDDLVVSSQSVSRYCLKLSGYV